jgi:hypothetical protein
MGRMVMGQWDEVAPRSVAAHTCATSCLPHYALRIQPCHDQLQIIPDLAFFSDEEAFLSFEAD